MKKTRSDISLHELSKLKKQQKIFLRELNAVPTSPLPAAVESQAAKGMGKPLTASNKVDPIDVILIDDISLSHMPPFLLTYEIFNRNLHNCLIDSRASSNIMLTTVCANVTPKKSVVHITQFDRTKVEVLGEIS